MYRQRQAVTAAGRTWTLAERVRVSERGLVAVGRHYAQFSGSIIGWTREEDGAWVRWDGQVKRSAWSFEYLTPLPPESR